MQRLISKKAAAFHVALIALAGFVTLLPGASFAQKKDVKIGMIGPFSGPSAGEAKEVYDGFMLGIENSGGKLGGLTPTVLKEDDQFKPDVGLQAAHKLIEQDKIDVMIGPIYTNVMLAAYGTIMENKIPLISPVSGPSLVAGKQCSPYFFSTSWQNEEGFEALGQALESRGIKSVYFLAPNYQAGKDSAAGLKRTFKGKMVGEVYTGLGQLDFAAEIAQIKSAKPDAVAVFYPASFGVNFTKQYGQSGLIKEIPLYSAFSIDETALPAIGDVAIGTFQTGSWNFDKPNPANVKFREDFIKEYKYRPTFVAAYAYDAARLLNAALTEVHGNLADKPALIAALDKANFASVRGKFKYAADHFPIQDFDLLEVEKAKDGTLVQVTRSTVLHDHSNAYVSQCQMPAP